MPSEKLIHSFSELIRVTYHPPQVPEPAAMIPVIEKCMFDYRRVYIEQPRVRLDGVYIANCHYVWIKFSFCFHIGYLLNHSI